MASLTEQLERLIEQVPGDSRVFKMNRATLDKNFGPGHCDKYPDDLVKKVSGIPITLDNSIEDDIIYLLNEEEKKEVYQCPDCGDEVANPGQCIFCFATANIEG